MSEQDKKKIIWLYFEEMYSIEKLQKHFDYKYKKSEIWGVLDTKWGD